MNEDYVEVADQPGIVLPRTLAVVAAAVNDSWLPYACLREAGQSPEDAMETSLRMNTPLEDQPYLDKFLSGRITRISSPEEGQEVKQGFITCGEKAWRNFQTLPDWGDTWPRMLASGTFS
jgi:hypothetical protein